MERLTDHHVNKSLGAYMVCSKTCDNHICSVDCEEISKIVDLLAAYEDTGMEPEEITTEPYGCVFYCNRTCNLDGDFCAEGPGCPHEINAETAKHLFELAQAEKDGRLVVLPCKPGDELTRNGLSFEADHWNVLLTAFADDASAPLGKRVALFSPEEAEAALKKREEADHEAI